MSRWGLYRARGLGSEEAPAGRAEVGALFEPLLPARFLHEIPELCVALVQIAVYENHVEEARVLFGKRALLAGILQAKLDLLLHLRATASQPLLQYIQRRGCDENV